MKKRWTFAAVLMAGALLLSTGCNSQPDPSSDPSSSNTTTTTAALVPLDIYKTAMEKYGAEQTMSSAFDMKITATSDGETVEMGMNGKIAAILETKEMAMDMTISFLGQEIPATYFYQNDTLYIDTMGQKIKQEGLSMEEASDQMEAPNFEFETDAIEDLKAERQGENVRLTFSVDLDAAAAAEGNDLLGSLATSMGVTEEDLADLDIPNPTVEMIVDKDGRLLSEKMSMAFSMTVEGTQQSVQLTFEITDIQYGADVKITPPADLDAYVEEDASLDDDWDVSLDDDWDVDWDA